MDVPARLRWRCRRGTRELDLILTRFLDQEYASLSSAEKNAFDELLLEQDPDLAAWLWGRDTVPERWRAVVERIQSSSNIDPVS